MAWTVDVYDGGGELAFDGHDSVLGWCTNENGGCEGEVVMLMIEMVLLFWFVERGSEVGGNLVDFDEGSRERD